MDTLGRIFKATREEKRVSASEAARTTRIKVQVIEAMERDDFSGIAAPAYAKGFIRIYAEYLGLNPEPLVQEYTRRHAPAQRSSLLGEEDGGSPPPPPKSQEPREPMPWPKIKWPVLNWPKIAWPAFSLPSMRLPKSEMKLPTVPPRLLIVYSVAIMLFLLFLFSIKRCKSEPDMVLTEPASDRISIDTPFMPDDEGLERMEYPLPVIEDVPEPYLE